MLKKKNWAAFRQLAETFCSCPSNLGNEIRRGDLHVYDVDFNVFIHLATDRSMSNTASKITLRKQALSTISFTAILS